jgi:hypothetical protein
MILKCHLLEGTASEYAGIVDEDVEPAEGFGGLGYGGLQRGGCGARSGEGKRSPSQGSDFVQQRLRALCRALIGNGDVGALRGKASGNSGANAAACARDEGSLSNQ